MVDSFIVVSLWIDLRSSGSGTIWKRKVSELKTFKLEKWRIIYHKGVFRGGCGAQPPWISKIFGFRGFSGKSGCWAPPLLNKKNVKHPPSVKFLNTHLISQLSSDMHNAHFLNEGWLEIIIYYLCYKSRNLKQRKYLSNHGK